MLAPAEAMKQGMRGFLLLGNKALLEIYNRGPDTAFRKIIDQKETVADNLKQGVRLDEMKILFLAVANVSHRNAGWSRREVLKGDRKYPNTGNTRGLDSLKIIHPMTAMVEETCENKQIDAFRLVMADFQDEAALLVRLGRTGNVDANS